MKKVFLSLAVLFSVALVSCGGNKAKEEAAEEQTPEVEVVDAVAAVDTVNPGTDSQQVDTIVAVAGEEVAQPEAK